MSSAIVLYIGLDGEQRMTEWFQTQPMNNEILQIIRSQIYHSIIQYVYVFSSPELSHMNRTCSIDEVLAE